MNGTAY